MDNKKKQKKEEEILNTSMNQDQDKVLYDENTEEESKEQALLQQLEELDQKYKRALADYQNIVRRTNEEKQEWAKLSNKELLLKILPILDTLILAQKHTKDETFGLTVQQFLQIVKEQGVERIETTGKMFDPLVMEAVGMQEGDENKVLEEVRAGYMLGEAVLRPAQVVVGSVSS